MEKCAVISGVRLTPNALTASGGLHPDLPFLDPPAGGWRDTQALAAALTSLSTADCFLSTPAGDASQFWACVGRAIERSLQHGSASFGALWNDATPEGGILTLAAAGATQCGVTIRAVNADGAVRDALRVGPFDSSVAAFRAFVEWMLYLERRVLPGPRGVRPWVQPSQRPRRVWIARTDPDTWIEMQAAGEQTVYCPPAPSAELVLLSAAGRGRLLDKAAALIARLESGRCPSLAELARQCGRDPADEHRLALIAASAGELREKLIAARTRIERTAKERIRTRDGVFYGCGPKAGKIAVLFPGQGSQYPGMLAGLCRSVAGIREWFDLLDGAYLRRGAAPLSELLHPSHDAAIEDLRLVALDGGAQLGLVASLALYSVLRGMGIQPDVLAGHSNGEHAALFIAGAVAFDSHEAVCERACDFGLQSRLLATPVAPEGMLAVGGLPAAKVQELIRPFAGRLYLAIDNCPTQILLAGRQEALDQATPVLKAAGAICTSLPFTRAHHTPLFRDWTALLDRHYQSWQVRKPSLRVFSCRTAQPYPTEPAAIRALLASQWSNTVRFRETLEALHADGVRIFIEAGPDNKLTAFVNDTLRKRPHLAVAASASGVEDFVQLRLLAAELYAAGVAIDPDILAGRTPAPRLFHPETDALAAALRAHREMVILAAAAQDRVAARMGLSKQASSTDANRWPLLGTVLVCDGARLRARRTFTLESDPWLADHALGRPDRGPGRPLPVLAFTVAMEIVAEAACRLTGLTLRSLSGLRAHRWLALDGGSLSIEVDAEIRTAGRQVAVRVYEVRAAERTLAFEGLAGVGNMRMPPEAPRPPSAAAPPVHWDAGAFYRDYAFHGPGFRGLRRILSASPGNLEAAVSVTALTGLDTAALQLDPALLDCAGQLAALQLLDATGEKNGAFPFAAAELIVYGGPPRAATTLHLRGHAVPGRFDTITSAFDFVSADGALLMRLTGFEQRLIRFAGRSWDMLFGREPLDLPALLAADPALLTKNGGIWRRACASLLGVRPEALKQKFSHNLYANMLG